jgi:hypothetical protein
MWIRLACLLVTLAASVTASAQDLTNPLIDYDTFAKQVTFVGELRNTRRVSEAQFMRMARDPHTVVLDARSAEKFALLHVKGAKNLSLPDMTAEDLARIIPNKSTRVLIYCNNNFLREPEAFRTKAFPASLNIYTFNVLHSYGYTNVYELGPLIDIHQARLKFAGSLSGPDGRVARARASPGAATSHARGHAA